MQSAYHSQVRPHLFLSLAFSSWQKWISSVTQLHIDSQKTCTKQFNHFELMGLPCLFIIINMILHFIMTIILRFHFHEYYNIYSSTLMKPCGELVIPLCMYYTFFLWEVHSDRHINNYSFYKIWKAFEFHMQLWQLDQSCQLMGHLLQCWKSLQSLNLQWHIWIAILEFYQLP